MPAAPALAQAPAGLHVEAARGHWHDTAPPADGWVAVELPDNWSRRWPNFDGVVWYRLSWLQQAPAAPTGLLLRYLNMAGAVYFNGTQIGQDAQLVEPLTRSWNTPRHWLLAPPLLREGRNTLLVRVAGFSAYDAGLGPVVLGPPARILAEYQHEQLLRHDLQLLGLAVSSVIACFFGTLWLMRRRETAYGWFALMTLFWLLTGLNHIVTSPWPFQHTGNWQAFNIAMLLAFTGAFAVFALRLCGHRLPRTEAVMALVILAGWIDLWRVPHDEVAVHRIAWTMLAALTVLGICLWFLAQAWRSREAGPRALAPFMVVVMAADVHDTLVFVGILDSNRYFTAMSSYVLVLGMALILAWRFADSLRRIENFNSALIGEVGAAKAELTATLARAHALEVAHIRARERVSLANDLHDGLGGMLVGSIATLEHAPEKLPPPQVLSMLKNLRDDLRLILDTAGPQHGLQAMGELLAPLRHRMGRLFEANEIACHWHLEDIDTLTLEAPRALGVLRFLQEALTNVLKHSGADRVDVRISREGQHLALCVRDNGRGFTEGALVDHPGTGMRSMRARAARLGGTVQWTSRPGDTRVRLRLDLP